MSRPLHLACAEDNQPAQKRAVHTDIRLSVHVNQDTELAAKRYSTDTVVTIQCPLGGTAVDLYLCDDDFKRLVTALAEAWMGAAK